jgi:hypothetical protein
MQKQDRVTLVSRPEFIGTIVSDERRGLFEVEFDGGGRGFFNVHDLQLASDAPVTNKTWPPSGLETKVGST